MHVKTILMQKLAILWLFLVLINSGCLPEGGLVNASLLLPANGARFSTEPNEYRIVYPSIPSAIRVTLNGQDITPFFVFADTSASALGVDLAGYLAEGENVLALNSIQASHFFLDSKGPSIAITAVVESNPLLVSGRVIDPGGVDSLQINGALIDLADETFNHVALDPGGPFIFEAIDTLGNMSTTRFTRQITPLTEAVKARVSQKSIDVIAPFIGEEIVTTDLQPLVDSLNDTDIFDSVFWGNGVRIQIRDGDDQAVTLDSVILNALDIVQNGRINLGVDVNDIIADLHVDIYVLYIRSQVDMQFSADAAHVGGTVQLNGDAGGNIVVSFPDFNLRMSGTGINIDILPDSLESVFAPVMGPVMDTMLDLLGGWLSGIVVDSLEDVLADQLSTLIINTDIDIAGIGLRMDALLDDIDSQNNNLVVNIGAAMKAAEIDPLVAPTLGYVVAPDALPEPEFNAYDFGATVSSDLLNQSVYAAYQGGLMHITLMGEDTHFGTSAWPIVRDGTRVRIIPSGPALLIMGGSNVDAFADINLYTVMVYFEILNNGSYQPAIAIEMDANVKALMTAENDSLGLSFPGNPNIKVSKVDNLLLPNVPIAPEMLESIINLVAPVMMQPIAKTIEAIKLPKIKRMGINASQLNAEGQQHRHLGVYGNFYLQ